MSLEWYFARPLQRPLSDRLLLYKRYFEIGGAITVYPKYLIALFGLSSRDVWTTMSLGLAYAVATFAVGYWWHVKGLMRKEFEIMNNFNPMADDVRTMAQKRAS